MNKIRSLLIVTYFLFKAIYANAWGVYGHQHIADAAILALPADMGLFFYDHSDFLIEESVVPDLRKYTLGDKSERPRHYIDLEAYHYTTVKEMPQTMKDAAAMYSADSLLRYGILPWYIQTMMEKLTTAMKNKRKDEILFLAGDLCHYIADAHMPLHTTINHDGQYTQQEGIHAFWESQLPEMFGDTYNLHTEKGKYIDNITNATWQIIADTYPLADTLLLKEKQAAKEMPTNEQYKRDKNGQAIMNIFMQPEHTDAYASLYHKLLNGMVEQQMRKAIFATASFWYTAWVNAGKPDLSDLDNAVMKKRKEQYYQTDLKAWQKGKLPALKTIKEFK